MIVFPKDAYEAAAALGPRAELRAGGTDWQERRQMGRTKPDIVDLRDTGMDTVKTRDGGAIEVGARVSLATIAAELKAWPALALAAGALATPQIRAAATLGGSLCQRSRCWYYRSPEVTCFRSGGNTCPARDGDAHFLACFDRGGCIAPHPSTVGMALLNYDATVVVAGGPDRSIAAFFGDGTDPRRNNTLAERELIAGIRLPAPLAGEQGGYFRAISRAYAEWPLVEASVRLVVERDVVRFARVAIGGVASTPLRLPRVEQALVGARQDGFAKAAALAVGGAKPLPQTRYKLELVPGTIVEALERALV